jgi:Fe-S-cluster containining protein
VEAVDKLKASGLLGKPEMPDVFSYLDLDIPCPFLMDRECLIYADRPMGCRSHMTKDSPDGCKTREGRKEQIYLASPESMNFSFKVLLQTQDYLLMDFFPLLLADEMEMPSAEWEGRTKVLIERIG